MTYSVIAVGDEEAAFDAAQAAVAAGEVIVVPTDTIYGVGALATSGAAVQRLLDAKERGRDMPPPSWLPRWPWCARWPRASMSA